MKIPKLPQVVEIRALMADLGHAKLRLLAADSGVPFTTLWKIKTGETENPGLETCAKFLPHIKPRLSQRTKTRATPKGVKTPRSGGTGTGG